MSTFNGFVDGFDCLSVDRFIERNCDAKVFFLSHCHTDHMQGLNKVDDENELPGPLYLSEVSAVIIKKIFPAIKQLVVLRIGDATEVIINENERFTVTALPAGHCPGSVMFLFEGFCKSVLYTGDFRLNASSIENMSALKKYANSALTLDCLYMDSTFFSLEYQYFPSQRQSVETIIKLSKEWLERDPRNIVVIRPPANIGYEFVVTELSISMKQRIHVGKALHAEYCAIPELSACITQAMETVRIHLCTPENNNLSWHKKQCGCFASLNDANICIIRPTAMKWTNIKSTDVGYAKHDTIDSCYFVCYSNHSSYMEIKHLIEYLRPHDIKLNVVPTEYHTTQNMIAELKRIMDIYMPAKKAVVDDSTELDNYKFDINWSKVKSQVIQFDDEITKMKVKRRNTDNEK